MTRTLVHCMLILLALWSAPVSAHAATVLFGFETDADLKLWHYEGSPDTAPREVSLAPGFATCGEQSLVFSFPQWKPGLFRRQEGRRPRVATSGTRWARYWS